MTLHGHTKIELTDIHTGAVETIEKDNIVTNAVSEILNGYGGRCNIEKLLFDGESNTGDYDSLITPFYGGLLLYNKALGSDPDTFFAPADAGISGCAVYNITNTGTNKTRGSCNKTETSLDIDKGIATFVYDFTTSQGNGVIASVCLTSLLGGYFSETPEITKPTDNANGRYYLRDGNVVFQPYSKLLPALQGTNIFNSAGRLIFLDTEHDKAVFGKLTYANEKYTLTISEYSADLAEIDLFRNKGAATRKKASTDIDVTSVILYNSYDRIRITCDVEQGKFYLVSMPNDSVKPNGTFNVREFDMNTYEFRDYTITNTTSDTFSYSIFYSGSDHYLHGRVYGGSIYMRAGSPTKIYRIRLDSPADVVQINMNGIDMTNCQDAHDGRLYQYGGLDYGVVLNTNDNKLYAMEASGDYDSVGSWSSTPYYPITVPIVGESVTTMLARYTNNGCEIQRSLRRNYLATINDLSTPVTKTADKTMKITYTLRKA